MSKIAFVAIHGMGEMSPDYADRLWDALRPRLGPARQDIVFGSIYYRKILQANEREVWDRVERGDHVRYAGLRKFILFGFGDAAGLENRKEDDDSVYELAQLEIARTLFAVRARCDGNVPLVLMAHSLGCHVLSSYIYDAQKAAQVPVRVGIWKDIQRHARAITGRATLSDEEIAFLRCDTCTGWVTTGCNIPIFVAAHKTMTVLPIRRPTPAFRWLNYYDPDDVLGWPLQPLSDGYAELVEDRPINAGRTVLDLLLKSWNPLAHTLYWEDEDVLQGLVALLTA